MKKIFIVAEYNPFHNGHIYQLKKVKELYPDSLITIIMSGNYTMRGDISLLSENEKASIALKYGADLIIKLPFKFSVSAADIFAKGAIDIAKHLKLDTIIFGSESNNKDLLLNTAKNLLDEKKLDKNLSYPAAISKAYNIDLKPNDLLATSYIKEIIKNRLDIDIIPFKRTNGYYDEDISFIASGHSIRNAINNSLDFKNAVPTETYELLKTRKEVDIYKIFKHIVLTTDDLTIYNDINMTMHHKIKNAIKCNNLELFINEMHSKDITINKIKRAIITILTQFKYEGFDTKYIRILGFNSKGRDYLNKIKKELTIPLITNIKGFDKLLYLDNKTDKVYTNLTGIKIKIDAPVNIDL